MRTNVAMEKWGRGEVVAGSALSLGSVRSAEICARAGFDFLMVDTLHGYFDKADATNALRAIAMTDTVPFARVAHNDPGRINDLLDAGALGMVVPMVNSSEEARAAVKATFYHPKGERSKGSAVATFYGKDYHEKANALIALIVMIETGEAVDRVDDILGVEGVDGCLIGAGDLTLSLGCDSASEPFARAVAKVVAACRARGIAPGIAVRSADDVVRWRAAGMSFFLVSHDIAVLSGAVARVAGSLREVTGP